MLDGEGLEGGRRVQKTRVFPVKHNCNLAAELYNNTMCINAI